MKVLRIILVLVGLLLVLILGVGLFGPTSMEISHSKVVKAPMSSVFEQVVEFKNWPNWSPWAADDPEMKVTYEEKSRGEGGSYSWESEKSGKGRMEIREVVPGEKIGMDIGFDMGDGLQYSTCDMMFNEVEGATEVTWDFNSSGNDGFGERLMNVVMPSMLKGMYEKGLTNLEGAALANPYVEKKEMVEESGIREEDMEGFNYLGIRFSDINIADITQEMYATSFEKIAAHATVSGGADKIVPPPMAVNYAFDKETLVTTFSLIMRTSEKIEGTEEIESEFMKAHRAMVYTHVGPYENLPESYEKIISVLMAKGYEMLEPSYEVYLTDPGTEPDPTKWKTDVYIPIAWNE